MFVVRRGLVAFACVPLLLVGACGEDTPKSDGPSTQSPSSSTSISPSPSESESVLPEDQPASEVTPEQIVHAWFEAYNDLTLTGDASRLRSMSLEKCLSCTSIAEHYETVYEAGGSVDSDGLPNTVSAIEEGKGSTEQEPYLTVEFNTSAGESKESKDAKLVKFAQSSFTWVFLLVVVDDQWRVSRVGA